MTDHEEPPGYENTPGFVKSNPNNNAIYVEWACDIYPMWADIIRETDAQLEALAPGYNIDQIKDKFGGLRFYASVPEWVHDGIASEDAEVSEKMDKIFTEFRDITWDVEAKAVRI